MLTMTDNAVSAIRSLVHESHVPEGAGLRIAPVVKQDGSPAFAAELAAGPAPLDEVIDIGGARVFLAPAAATALDHKTLGARVSEQGQVRFQVSERGE
ncbi:Fe-S cluster assembly protein HesB [Jiangella asiatica]|uniref:Fe-S cluster assembly protein HesB n=1 Tax=Jiangella asiatica TaxID=2530372 RepID=A0A4R5CMK4_9ACTN|nr:Fe-S cluster assembly protein HesB [Jiangella asiatica]TDD99930.1 Fe-S cluster assembly protein HesB [Jiangella asiatica]